MKILKKLISISCAFIVSTTFLSAFISVAETDRNLFLNVNDGIWMPLDETDIPCYDDVPASKLFGEDAPRNLRSSVDNSASSYFPAIGNQGEINSCVGWATTYYQFTYEVNRFRGISTNYYNTYSPSWTYNYVNGGANIRTYWGDAYNVLKYHGAMKLSDYPYSPYQNSYNYSWSNDINKMTEALKYRAQSWYLTASSSDNIYNIKNMLSNGNIAVVWTDPAGWTIKQTTNNEWIGIRCSIAGGGHYMTVVGYDDNITVQVDPYTTMVGAFKVANSEGTGFANNGYIWVAYDALNATSSYSTGWENGYTDIRQPIFNCSSTYDNNGFVFASVNFYRSYLVGKVIYWTNDPWHTNIYGDLSSTQYLGERFIPLQYYYNMSNISIPNLNSQEYKAMVFDYFDVPNPAISYYLSSSFTTKLENNTTNNTSPIYLSVMDNLCNEISPANGIYGSLSSGEYSRSFTMDLAKGRISHYNSNPINSNDVGLLSSYLLGNSQLSSIQWYLADMNDDNTVDSIDLALMQQAIGRQNNSDNVLDVFIPELNATIREYILNQNDMETLTRVENALAS